VSGQAIRRIVRRALADQDIEGIVDHYLEHADAPVALAFLEVLQEAFGQLARQPGMGSPRRAQELALPGLRSWALRSYPYIVFYFEAPDAIEIWRVLHERRDIPVHLQGFE
jgi:toxin ParE1/3/4